MKKIDLKPYSVEGRVLDEETNQIKTMKMPYDVVMSIENIVLASGQMTNQQLTMAALLRASRVVEDLKAQSLKQGFALLEEADYNIIKSGFDAFKGFGLNEVELCRRIEEAETVEVEEKEEKKKKEK